MIDSYMAKPTKYAPHICTACTLIALLGIVLGFVYSAPIIPVLFLLPAAFYEAYRTEGKYTKQASYILVIVLIAELLLVLFNVNFNIAEFLGAERKMVGGYWVPLGDLKIVGPTVIAILSIVLFSRTRGIYTRWLAVVIFITSFAIVYMMDPIVFQDLLKYGLNEGLNNISI